MTTKEWLKRGFKLNETINKKLEAQYKAYNLACSTTSCVTNEKVQTSCKNSMEDNFARYIDLTNEINKHIDELYTVRVETLRAVNCVENELFKTILKLRFVYFKPWGYIAHEINKPVSSVKQYYLGKAIKQFDTIYCII